MPAIAPPTADLLVGSVRDDTVQPGAECSVTSEGIDLPDHGPECVLHRFLGILPAARDADRQPIGAVSVSSNQPLGCAWLLPTECVGQAVIVIVAMIRADAATRALHAGDASRVHCADPLRLHRDVLLVD